MVYSRIINVTDCIVPDPDNLFSNRLEPGYVLRGLPKEWLDSQSPVVILIRDDTSTLEFTLDSFLKKSYAIRNGKVRIGPKLFTLSQLSIHVGHKIILQNIDSIIDKSVD